MAAILKAAIFYIKRVIVKVLILLLAILPLLGSAQVKDSGFPVDTTFNVKSACRKIAKEFPYARGVKEFNIQDIEEMRNLVYYTLGKRSLHIDVFSPVEKKCNVPAIMLIHGGGWASGSKSHLVPLAQKIAEAGFVTATVEYRLSPEAKYPAAINDLKTALRWLKVNGEEFGVDTGRIAVLGTSAGATLATLLGTTVGNSKFPSHSMTGEANDRVHAIINIDGVVDFTDPNESGKDTNPEKPSAGARWFGATYRQNPKLWIEASPITYVNENTPPTIFINSALPRFHAGRDYYLKELNRNSVYNQVHTIKESPHPFWLCYPWFDEVVAEVSDFLNIVFK